MPANRTALLAAAWFAAMLFCAWRSDAALAMSDEASSELRRMCASKAALLKRYLEKPSISEIERTEDETARTLVAAARSISDAFNVDAVGSDGCEEINEALRVLSIAAASGAKPVSQSNNPDLYRQRSAQIAAYLQAVASTRRETWPDAAKRQYLQAELDSAEAARLWEQGDVSGAIARIEAAYRIVLDIVKTLNDGKLVVHELIFRTPGEEFQYELDRNRSFEMLLEIAVQEKPPSLELAAHINQVKADNGVQRQKAEEHYQTGQPETAIRELETASRNLAKALRLLGVMVWE